MFLASGVARGVHVGSSAPNPYTSAPILCRCRLVFLPKSIKVLTHCMCFYYTATASNIYAGTYTQTFYMEQYPLH